jgi:hypothetical protein
MGGEGRCEASSTASRWDGSTVMVWIIRVGEGRAVIPCYLVIFPQALPPIHRHVRAALMCPALPPTPP